MARGHCQWRGPGPRRAAGGDPILHVGYLFPVKPEIIIGPCWLSWCVCVDSEMFVYHVREVELACSFHLKEDAPGAEHQGSPRVQWKYTSSRIPRFN